MNGDFLAATPKGQVACVDFVQEISSKPWSRRISRRKGCILGVYWCVLEAFLTCRPDRGESKMFLLVSVIACIKTMGMPINWGRRLLRRAKTKRPPRPTWVDTQ